jgi:DNA modification methylase
MSKSKKGLDLFQSAEFEASTLPKYSETILDFKNSGDVFQELKSLDWSFTDHTTGFLTHDLHPYPAKYIPQIPGNLITRLSSRGELVMDPFGGSGTTALEAIRLGRRALSIDANPVATLIGTVKTIAFNDEASLDVNILHASLKSALQSLPKDPQEFVRKYAEFIPKIANREKWFPDTSCGELALIRFRIHELTSEVAKNIALLALSRIVLLVSFQDSETRYKSVPRVIPQGETLKRYLRELENSSASIRKNGEPTWHGAGRFVTADIRTVGTDLLPDNCADLIITSPPYGNATDYHLYHRFRILWLGFDPIALGRIEIGSHLKHQREDSGFESYQEDMTRALATMHRALKSGRYAALVIGDAMYKGELFLAAEILEAHARQNGFDASHIITRPIHQTKRSFNAGARRATTEKILVIRKASSPVRVILQSPPYKLWPYEQELRNREVSSFTKNEIGVAQGDVKCEVEAYLVPALKQMVFTHQIEIDGGVKERSWQAIIENGMAASMKNRKDPKYVTHGIHPYKGKFYPQLAKGLINLVRPKAGSIILDPFCGSGTTLLEGELNGLQACGSDMNPLAAKIAKAKTGIIQSEPAVLEETVAVLNELIRNVPANLHEPLTEFNHECLDEIGRWFPVAVAQKLNWLLKTIRRISDGIIRDFLEVILSSVIRDVSQQDPTDLRIRYRKFLIEDADVFGLFSQNLKVQCERVEKFWSVRGHSPYELLTARVVEGDNRNMETFSRLGLQAGTVDLVLTSPPYATALPYIDTDRLSLLSILGIPGSERRPLEQNLIGSREITTSSRRSLEKELRDGSTLPLPVLEFIQNLELELAKTDAGFRKLNMPSLLVRFFTDMQKVWTNCYALLKKGGEAMIVIGDNRISVGEIDERIPTTDFVQLICIQCGFELVERIDISVTTENLLHIKNAITENVVLRLRK